MLFFMHRSHPVPPFLTPGLLSSTYTIPYFCTITHRHPNSSPSSSPSCPAGESLCIVVSSWIWKPHSGVNVSEVWQQQSVPIEGGIKTVRRYLSLWKGGGQLHSVICLWLGRRLSDGGQKAAFKALIARHSEIPLKVSFPSNYILRFISAFRQTVSEAFGESKKKKKKKENAKKLCSISLCFFYMVWVCNEKNVLKLDKMENKLSIYLLYIFPLISRVITPLTKNRHLHLQTHIS